VALDDVTFQTDSGGKKILPVLSLNPELVQHRDDGPYPGSLTIVVAAESAAW
jgi:hypothetical protein